MHVHVYGVKSHAARKRARDAAARRTADAPKEVTRAEFDRLVREGVWEVQYEPNASTGLAQVKVHPSKKEYMVRVRDESPAFNQGKEAGTKRSAAGNPYAPEKNYKEHIDWERGYRAGLQKTPRDAADAVSPQEWDRALSDLMDRQSGRGWTSQMEAYKSARKEIVARLGAPPAGSRAARDSADVDPLSASSAELKEMKAWALGMGKKDFAEQIAQELRRRASGSSRQGAWGAPGGRDAGPDDMDNAELREAYNLAVGSGNAALAAQIKAVQERRASGAVRMRRDPPPTRTEPRVNRVTSALLRGRRDAEPSTVNPRRDARKQLLREKIREAGPDVEKHKTAFRREFPGETP